MGAICPQGPTDAELAEQLTKELGLKVGQKWFVKLGSKVLEVQIKQINGQVIQFNNFELSRFGLETLADGNWYCINDIKFIQQDTRPEPPRGGGDMSD